MDLIKIGKFISELRAEKGLTQEQLGEILFVTNKTISRWETGKYLPPADMLMKMSELFSVSINEILSGKRLSETEYVESAEENLKTVISERNFSLKEKYEYFGKKWLKEHIALMVLMAVIILSVLALGIIIDSSLIGSLSVILFVVFHAIRNNMMMTYIENNVYGKVDKNKNC